MTQDGRRQILLKAVTEGASEANFQWEHSSDWSKFFAWAVGMKKNEERLCICYPLDPGPSKWRHQHYFAVARLWSSDEVDAETVSELNLSYSQVHFLNWVQTVKAREDELHRVKNNWNSENYRLFLQKCKEEPEEFIPYPMSTTKSAQKT